MADVHASAVVDPAARLADGVQVGPLCVIEADVEVASGTRLLPGTVLLNGTRVGARCTLGPYAVLGGAPMDNDHAGEASEVIVGDDVEVRDFATIHRATGSGNATRVGSDALVMSYAHVSHNAQVGRGVVLTTTVQLGGHAEVHDYATLGAGAMVHQFTRVGAYAMVGAASAVNRDVLPFALARGTMAEHYRLNGVGLKRHGIDGDRYRDLERAFRALRKRDDSGFEALADASHDVAFVREFIAASRRGISAFRGRA